MDNSEITWVSVNEALPDTTPCKFQIERSEKVLVRGEGKNVYPWVAHLWVDPSQAKITWLCPYRDPDDNQQVTEWAYLSDSAIDDAFSLGVEAGRAEMAHFLMESLDKK